MLILVIPMLSGTLRILGCDSDDGGAAGSGGAGGTAGAGGSAGAGGAGGMGGEGGAGGSPAAAFCDRYETICTFGGEDRYTDEAACLDAYENSGQSACYETHLELAESDATTHCPHATGIGECVG
jgi:hypothetical protein